MSDSTIHFEDGILLVIRPATDIGNRRMDGWILRSLTDTKVTEGEKKGEK